MANKTYNDHPTDNTPAADDLIPYWDVAAGAAKKTTRANLIGGLLTGSGTVATGGYTLTVPATGTAALRNTAQTFAGLQTFGNGINLGGANLTNYEEGTWAVTVTGSVSNPTVTYQNQTGYYTRIGNRVLFNLTCNISSMTGGSGNAQLSLPIPSASGGYGICAVVYNGLTVPGGGIFLSAQVQSNSSVLLLLWMRNAAVALSADVASLGASPVIYVGGSYRAA